MSDSTYPLYTYPARAVRVIDGDTVDVIIDSGFHSYRKERLRLLGVNAPEMHGPSKAAGEDAKGFTLVTLIQWDAFDDETWPLLVTTQKTDVFGRYLAKIVAKKDPSVDLSTLLLQNGKAVPFNG